LKNIKEKKRRLLVDNLSITKIVENGTPLKTEKEKRVDNLSIIKIVDLGDNEFYLLIRVPLRCFWSFILLKK
jgi:hypothetical protein